MLSQTSEFTYRQITFANIVNKAASQLSDISTELIATGEDDNHTLPQQSSPHIMSQTKRHDDSSSVTAPSDLWSKAYYEAVNSLGTDIDVAILMGNNAAQLFKQLEEMGKEANQESIFLRGVAYLRSIQVPLEKLKLALDLASPPTILDPATTVFGVVRSVTAVSLFASNLAPDVMIDLSKPRLP